MEKIASLTFEERLQLYLMEYNDMPDDIDDEDLYINYYYSILKESE